VRNSNNMNRRDFLGGTIAGAAACAFGTAAIAESNTETIILSAPLTHSDWMLRPGVEWGDAGERHMLDACKAAGWSRIFWRVFDGGRSLYASRLMKPAGAWDADSFWSPKSEADRQLVERFSPGVTAERRRQVLDACAAMDYAHFDSLKAAVAYGHSIGLQIHAWASINEDDHGWGLQSEFSKQHPQYRWVRRDGRAYHSQMSFAFDAVRDYKLSLVKELLDGYDVDGLLLDWIRTGDVRDNPQNDSAGLADYGYESPNVERFRAAHNIDPHDVPADDERWLRVRSEPQTVFMRAVRELVDSKSRTLPVAALVGHPWHYRGLNDPIAGNLKGLSLDIGTWAAEGLVDAVVAAGYYLPGGTPENAYGALKAETGGKVDVWTYAWVPNTVAEFERDFGVAQSVGAKQMLLWEADYIDGRTNAAELSEAMRRRSA
jgi:hypothetical protein